MIKKPSNLSYNELESSLIDNLFNTVRELFNSINAVSNYTYI